LMAIPPESDQFEVGKGKRGLDHIGFKVKDLPATLEEMKKKSVRITQELTVMPSGAKIAFVEGPDGIRIELLQRD
jgi:lactoylglutathione lyase